MFFSCLAEAFDPRHKLRAGKNAGTPFLGLACPQRAVVGAVLGPRATAGTGLTIRSSRDRFAASCKSANFYSHKAAKRPGLTQALAECGQAFKRRILNLFLHSLARESQERLAGLDQRRFLTLYVNCSRAANRGSKAAYSANNSFKPRPLRGLARDSLAGCGPA